MIIIKNEKESTENLLSIKANNIHFYHKKKHCEFKGIFCRCVLSILLNACDEAFWRYRRATRNFWGMWRLRGIRELR